jgi:hypothetical protein
MLDQRLFASLGSFASSIGLALLGLWKLPWRLPWKLLVSFPAFPAFPLCEKQCSKRLVQALHSRWMAATGAQ